jgi:hypothetical protein
MRYALALLMLIPAVALAQTTPKPKVYVDPDNPFSSDFEAGIQKKQVPVILTDDRDQSDYTVTLKAESSHDSRTRVVSTALTTDPYADDSWDRMSMTVMVSKTKDIVFSYTCQKSSDNDQAVTECLAQHWKDQLKKK